MRLKRIVYILFSKFNFLRSHKNWFFLNFQYYFQFLISSLKIEKLTLGVRCLQQSISNWLCHKNYLLEIIGRKTVFIKIQNYEKMLKNTLWNFFHLKHLIWFYREQKIGSLQVLIVKTQRMCFQSKGPHQKKIGQWRFKNYKNALNFSNGETPV
jgi:hypothetical protein